MLRYIMSITAQDRPGIVAAVSEAVLELNGNLQAVSQTVHQGFFAMMILCALQDHASPEQLQQLVHQKAGADLHVFVTEFQPVASAVPPHSQRFIVTAVGADKPGILHKLASYLAAKQINIDDLYAYIDDREGDFVVICQVSVPPELDIFMLQADLEAAGEQGGFRAVMQHENIFTATNDLWLGRSKTSK